MKKMFAIKNAQILTAEGLLNDGCLIVKDGRIEHVGTNGFFGDMPVIDAANRYLSPGFIDIHLHGGGGADFMDGEKDTYRTVAEAHVKHGTTSMMPTTVSDNTANILEGVCAYRRAKNEKLPVNLLGLHLEGPYLSKNQAGAHVPQHLRHFDEREYTQILEAGGGDIVRWSAAPELPGAEAFAKKLKKWGVVPSVAHSDADYHTVLKAYQNGFTLITHLYSAMSTVKRVDGFRVAGVLESAFLIDGMDVELIADGCHLPPELLVYVCKFKPKGNIALVTDAMRAAGQTDGKSYLGKKGCGIEVIVEDGVAKLKERSAFAGSVATADRLLRTMIQKAKLPVVTAVKMLTENPLRMIGSKLKKGVLKNGYDADLVLFDGAIKVHSVWVGGALKARDGALVMK